MKTSEPDRNSTHSGAESAGAPDWFRRSRRRQSETVWQRLRDRVSPLFYRSRSVASKLRGGVGWTVGGTALVGIAYLLGTGIYSLAVPSVGEQFSETSQRSQTETHVEERTAEPSAAVRPPVLKAGASEADSSGNESLAVAHEPDRLAWDGITPYLLPTHPLIGPSAEELTANVAECRDQCTPGFRSEDRSLGTRLTWAESIDKAALTAAREGKLMYVIHVSGNFESEGFT